MVAPYGFFKAESMKRHELYDLSRDEIIHYADQYIHNSIYRKIFIDRYCDGITFDNLSEEYHLEPRHIQTLMKECMKDVLKGIERSA